MASMGSRHRCASSHRASLCGCGCWLPLASAGLRWPGWQGRCSCGPPDLVQRGEAPGRLSGAAQGRVTPTALHRPAPSGPRLLGQALGGACLPCVLFMGFPAGGLAAPLQALLLQPVLPLSTLAGQPRTRTVPRLVLVCVRRPSPSPPAHLLFLAPKPVAPAPARCWLSGSFGPLAVPPRSSSPQVVGGSPGWASPECLSRPRGLLFRLPVTCCLDGGRSLPGLASVGGRRRGAPAPPRPRTSWWPSAAGPPTASVPSPLGGEAKALAWPPRGVPLSVVAGAPAFPLVLMLSRALTPCAGGVAPELRSPPTWPPASPSPDHTWNMGVRLVSQGGKLQEVGAVCPDRSVRIPRVAPAGQAPGEVKVSCENKGRAAEG